MNTTIFTEHNFDLSAQEAALFEKFLRLFLEYNAHTNLSAIRDEAGIVEKHFVDSLYGAPIIAEFLEKKYLQQSGTFVSLETTHPPCPPNGGGEVGMTGIKKLLDIGSGGGFPGIPLKIVLPDLDVTLLDSVGKKVRAMDFFIQNLELSGIAAMQERAEVLAKDEKYRGKYDFVVSRATAYMTDILTWAKPFLAPDGKILLYKMPSDEEKRDRDRITKKLGLTLEAEMYYTLGGKERVIYVFSQKNVGQAYAFG